MNRFLRSAFFVGLAVVLGCLVYKCSMHLAGTRIYDVDECRNAWLARALAMGHAAGYTSDVNPLLIPLIWVARNVTQSSDLLVSARLLSLLIFWINLLLLVMATGEKLVSRRGLFALIGAATLAPLWDFGFEYRSENLLLTELLATWCLVRFGGSGMSPYLFAGASSVAMQFTSSYAWVYSVPLTLVLFLIPRSRELSRGELLAAWVAGVVGMLLLLYVCYRATGIWDNFVAGLPLMWRPLIEKGEAGPWRILSRLLWQTPLVLALLLPGLIAVAKDLCMRGRAATTWEGCVPEALFFLLGLMGLIFSRAPQPHDLLVLVAFAYLLAYRYACALISQAWSSHLLRPLIVTTILFAQLVPFYASTRRLLAWPNHRQEGLMQFAEQLTSPANDRVYDGVGMVAARPTIRSQWFLESLGLRASTGDLETLAGSPAAVVIRSFRAERMPNHESDFVRNHYVPLADDILVLGRTLPKGGGEFEVVYPGRYRVSPRKQSNIQGTYPEGLAELIAAGASKEIEVPFTGTVDGMAVSNRPIELKLGMHRVESGSDDEIAVVWVGPRLEKPPQVGRGDRRRLFVNWQ